MFKAKRRETNEIVVVLDSYFDLLSKGTWFLIWENNGWRWRPADRYVPPNVEVKDGQIVNLREGNK